MGLFSRNDDGKTVEERAVDREQHRAYRAAGNQAARAHRDAHVVHDQLNEAIIDAERDVPWWRRLWDRTGRIRPRRRPRCRTTSRG